MIANRNVGSVLRKVAKEVSQHDLPVVTLVAQMKKDPYRVLIATILSLRTKDAVTAVASDKLFAIADTPKKMLQLSEKRIQKVIYPVGFYKTKARTIRNISRLLLEKYNGEVPNDLDELMTFPGVGRKTANLVLIEGFGELAMCVDTHVHRISNRWGYVQTNTPDDTEQALRKKLPKKYWIRYNELLVSFGQHLCAPVSPKCSQCPIRKQCPRVGVTTSR